MTVLGTPPTSKDRLRTRAGKTLRVPTRTKCSPLDPPPPVPVLVLVPALDPQSVDPCCVHVVRLRDRTLLYLSSSSQKHLTSCASCAPPPSLNILRPLQEIVWHSGNYSSFTDDWGKNVSFTSWFHSDLKIKSWLPELLAHCSPVSRRQAKIFSFWCKFHTSGTEAVWGHYWWRFFFFFLLVDVKAEMKNIKSLPWCLPVVQSDSLQPQERLTGGAFFLNLNFL